MKGDLLPVAAACFFLAAACAEGEGSSAAASAPSAERWVILSTGNYNEPIAGAVTCNGPSDPICTQDPHRLAEAVVNCGMERVIIDTSHSHVSYVYFDVTRPALAESWPTELEVVRCVRERVGFRFSAGIAADLKDLPEQDQQPFESLHA